MYQPEPLHSKEVKVIFKQAPDHALISLYVAVAPSDLFIVFPVTIRITELKATGKVILDCIVPYCKVVPLLITDNYVINSVNMLCIR